ADVSKGKDKLTLKNQLCTQCMTTPMTHSLKDVLLTSETLLSLNYDLSKIMENNN
ncbi:unnamed protein product, partial [Coccothraustes coccothraustes]